MENLKDNNYRSVDIIDIQIAWHRDWLVLKSIHAVEHIHVFLKGPDEDFVQEITKGDTPAYLKPS